MFKAEPVTGAYIRNSDLNRRRLMHRAKTKSLRISVVIVAAFLIWWTPYYTMMIIFLFLDPDEHVSIDLPYNQRKYIILFYLLSHCRYTNEQTMLSAQRGVTERNIFLRHEQQLGKSFDIWCISSLATETTAGFLSKVNKIYETFRCTAYRIFFFSFLLLHFAPTYTGTLLEFVAVYVS